MPDLFVTAFFGLWALFSLKRLYKHQFFTLNPLSSLPALSFLHLLGAFFIFYVSYALLLPELALRLGLPRNSQLLGLTIFIPLFFLYCLLIKNQLAPYFQKKGFFIGMKSWLFIFPFIFLWAEAVGFFTRHLLGAEPQEQVAVMVLKESQGNPFVLSLMVVYVVLIVPVIEETLFRGFLQNWLRPLLGPYKAIFLTALIFAGFHYSPSQGLSNITILSSLFILACFLGALLERTQSLRAPMGLHATFNAMSVLFIFAKELT